MKIPKIAFYDVRIEPTPDNLVKASAFLEKLKKMQLCMIVSKVATKVYYNAEIVTYDVPIYIDRIKSIAKESLPDGFRIKLVDTMPYKAEADMKPVTKCCEDCIYCEKKGDERDPYCMRFAPDTFNVFCIDEACDCFVEKDDLH